MAEFDCILNDRDSRLDIRRNVDGSICDHEHSVAARHGHVKNMRESSSTPRTGPATDQRSHKVIRVNMAFHDHMDFVGTRQCRTSLSHGLFIRRGDDLVVADIEANFIAYLRKKIRFTDQYRVNDPGINRSVNTL